MLDFYTKIWYNQKVFLGTKVNTLWINLNVKEEDQGRLM